MFVNIIVQIIYYININFLKFGKYSILLWWDFWKINFLYSLIYWDYFFFPMLRSKKSFICRNYLLIKILFRFWISLFWISMIFLLFGVTLLSNTWKNDKSTMNIISVKKKIGQKYSPILNLRMISQKKLFFLILYVIPILRIHISDTWVFFIIFLKINIIIIFYFFDIFVQHRVHLLLYI